MKVWTPQWADLIGTNRSWQGAINGANALMSLEDALHFCRMSMRTDRESGFDHDFAYRVRNTVTEQTIVVQS